MWSVISEDVKAVPYSTSAMVSFNVDPQWCGLLFSIYCRHEKASLTGGFPSPDALATCAFQGPQLDADWLALAGTLGFELCRLSDTWALVFESVKATSVILLLGAGGLVCYKLYHYYWPRPRSPRSGSPGGGGGGNGDASSPRARRKLVPGVHGLGFTRDQLLEPGDEPGYDSVRTRYFGPNNPVYDDNSDSAEGSPYLADQSASTSPSDDSAAEDDVHVQKPWPCSPQRHEQRTRTWSSRRLRNSPRSPLSNKDISTEKPGWLLHSISNMTSSPGDNRTFPPRKGASLPGTPGRRGRFTPEYKKLSAVSPTSQYSEWQQSGRQAPEGAESTTRCHSVPRNDPPITNFSSPDAMCKMSRDISLDSLGFSDTGSCSRRFPREGSFDSTCSEFSIDISLKEPMDSATMACMEQLQQEIDQLKNNCLMMDEDFETIKCNRNVPGMSSLMHVSDHSNVNNTEDPLAESDAVKEEKARACFAGLYSLTTIKNSTSSELSECAVLSYKHGSMIDSIESLEWDSPKKVSPVKTGGVTEPLQEFQEVLEETFLIAQVQNKTAPQTTRSRSNTLVLSEDELMANLEWDNEDLTEYPDLSGDVLLDTEPNLLACVDTLEMDLETELALRDDCNRSEGPEKSLESLNSSRSCTASPVTERSLGEGSAVVGQCYNSSTCLPVSMQHQQQPHAQRLLPSLEQATAIQSQPWSQWNSEESGFMEWDAATDTQRSPPQKVFAFGSWADLSSATGSLASSSEQASPDSEIASLCSPCAPETPSGTLNVGPRSKLLQYAVREWNGHTKRAEAILKGYAEIPTLLGLEHIRPIRGDNYCAVRATIFQTLVQGVPVPSGHATFSRLSQAIDSGCSWIQDWQFAGRLPYCGNNVLHGMRLCLESLDNMASLLGSVGSGVEREGALAHLLNSDAALDLHLVEAVKLHMLACAMQLYDASCAGHQDVPLFAVLMFARDTCETPRDLMNNHLQAVGNTGGLEQVEMFLLGYSLGVTVRVVRPLAYGTVDFVCNFPDLNEEKWPHVILVAEDDRHYNVLL